jgi:hypothetical protein
VRGGREEKCRSKRCLEEADDDCRRRAFWASIGAQSGAVESVFDWLAAAGIEAVRVMFGRSG